MYKIIFANLLVDLLAFTIYLPLQPALLQHYGKVSAGDPVYQAVQSLLNSLQSYSGRPNDPAWDSVMFGGILGSSFSFLQFAVSPLYGSLSDSLGRRPLLIYSAIVTAASYFLWLQATTFTQFAIARALSGLGRAVVGVSSAAMADVFDKASRTKGMALVGIAFSVAFTIGPICGVIISRQFEQPFQAAAFLCLILQLISLAIVTFLYKETNCVKRPVSETLSAGLAMLRPWTLFGVSPSIRRISLVYFSFLFVYSGLEYTLSFLTAHRYGYDSNMQGRMYLFVGVIMLLVQGGIVRRGALPLQLAVGGLIAAIVSFTIMATPCTEKFFYVGLAIYSYTSAVVVTSLTSLVSQLAPSDNQGAVTGLLRSLGALARAVGPFCGCAFYWKFGASLTYAVGALLMLIPLILISFQSKYLPRRVEHSKAE